MKEDLHMDKAIREKLENFSAEPPSHVWSNIQEKMAMRQRKRRMAYITWTSVAAVVVFAFIAGWMLNKESGTISETFVEEKVLLPESKGKNVQPETNR